MALSLSRRSNKIAHIGNDQVDSQKIGAREHNPAVDCNGSIAIFDQHHVETELAEAAQRYDFKAVP